MNFPAYLPALIDFPGQGLVVSAAALSIGRVLRRASVERRHLVWLCAVGVFEGAPSLAL
jgi:hypothetical protein